MIEVKFPYKSHDNKHLWDYMTLCCSQLNNINLSKILKDNKNNYDNVMFVVIDYVTNSVNFLVSLSQLAEDKETYKPYMDIWTSLHDAEITSVEEQANIGIYCFDIKKYNFVLSFAEDYKNRDYIKFYVNPKTNKLFYCISENNQVDLSPFDLSQDDVSYIKYSYNKFVGSRLNSSTIIDILKVSCVDSNSFLLPYMAYKDFLNFTTYSVFNASYLLKFKDSIYFENILWSSNDTDYDFYSDIILRTDKFTLNADEYSVTQVSPGLWQILVMLQHIKYWENLYYYSNNTASLIFNAKNPSKSTVCHVFSTNHKCNSDPCILNLSKYKLVGEHTASELFRINKLYSNANRTCHFDYSNQRFIGNGYIFNDDKLEIKEIELDNKINAELPLKMTFTELKHYIGSDLSQKSYLLKVFTDGIRVMLERYDDEEHNVLTSRIVFNKNISKKNQNLTI